MQVACARKRGWREIVRVRARVSKVTPLETAFIVPQLSVGGFTTSNYTPRIPSPKPFSTYLPKILTQESRGHITALSAETFSSPNSPSGEGGGNIITFQGRKCTCRDPDVTEEDSSCAENTHTVDYTVDWKKCGGLIPSIF